MIVGIASIGLMVVNHLVVFAGEPYEISKIKSHLVLALDTHNVKAKVQYIDATIEKLEPYHGNSKYWYPVENTNIDKIEDYSYGDKIKL